MSWLALSWIDKNSSLAPLLFCWLDDVDVTEGYWIYNREFYKFYKINFFKKIYA